MSARLEDYEGALEIAGRVAFDRGWYLLRLDPALVAPLVAALSALDFATTPVPSPHVSILKDERPSTKQEKFGRAFVGELVSVRVCPALRHETGRHVWVDVHAPRLCELREHFGLPVLTRDGVYRVNSHLTLARIDAPRAPTPRPQYRLTPRTHIDVETLMQHL